MSSALMTVAWLRSIVTAVLLAGRSGTWQWISIWADGSLDQALVGRLVEQSHRMVALKRMIAAIDNMKRKS